MPVFDAGGGNSLGLDPERGADGWRREAIFIWTMVGGLAVLLAAYLDPFSNLVYLTDFAREFNSFLR